MVYTCAYYRDPDGDLATAQEDKLDLVCRKLRLEPGERADKIAASPTAQAGGRPRCSGSWTTRCSRTARSTT